MKWLCTVGVAVSLALQPALADELFGNHPLTPAGAGCLCHRPAEKNDGGRENRPAASDKRWPG